MRKTKLTVGIFGGYGQGNTGDEAILAEIVKQLRNCVDPVSPSSLRFIVFSYDKERTIRSSEIEWLRVLEWRRSHLSLKWITEVARTLCMVDLLIVGGGSVIFDRSVLPISLLVLFCKMLRKKVMCYAIGASDIRGRWQRFLAFLTLNSVDLITVRDIDARGFIGQLRVVRPPVIVTADAAMTMAMTPDECETAERLLLQEDTTRGQTPWIGISVRGWGGMSDDQAVFERIKLILREILRYLAEELNLGIVFVPLSYYEYDDRIVARELIRSSGINDRSRVRALEGEYSPNQIVEILGSMSMVIGMRLHSLILAALQGIPIVAINYDPKVRGFMRMVGQEDKSVEYYDTVAEALEMVRSVWTNRETISDQLKLRTSILRQRATLNAKLAMRLLQG